MFRCGHVEQVKVYSFHMRCHIKYIRPQATELKVAVAAESLTQNGNLGGINSLARLLSDPIGKWPFGVFVEQFARLSPKYPERSASRNSFAAT